MEDAAELEELEELVTELRIKSDWIKRGKYSPVYFHNCKRCYSDFSSRLPAKFCSKGCILEYNRRERSYGGQFSPVFYYNCLRCGEASVSRLEKSLYCTKNCGNLGRHEKFIGREMIPFEEYINKKVANGTTGCKGIRWQRDRYKSGKQGELRLHVSIKNNGKVVCLYRGLDLFDAVCAKKSAENSIKNGTPIVPYKRKIKHKDTFITGKMIPGVYCNRYGSYQVIRYRNKKRYELGTHKDFFEACCRVKSFDAALIRCNQTN